VFFSCIFLTRVCPLQYKARPAFLRKTVGDLGLGTFNNIATAKMETPLIQVQLSRQPKKKKKFPTMKTKKKVLDVFTDKRISCVPIIDDHGVVIDVYEKYDVTVRVRQTEMYLANPLPCSISLATVLTTTST